MNLLQRFTNPSVLPYPLVQYEYRQLAILLRLFERHQQRFPRLTFIRFDLHFPQELNVDDSKVISRFIDAFKARLVAWDNQRLSNHPIGFGYAWCREQVDSHNWHYHLIFVFNRDAVNCWGYFDLRSPNMYTRVVASWASALAIPIIVAEKGVHICENGVYFVDSKNPLYSEQVDAVMARLIYMAKKYSKDIGDGYRCFGCSQSIFLG